MPRLEPQTSEFLPGPSNAGRGQSFRISRSTAVGQELVSALRPSQMLTFPPEAAAVKGGWWEPTPELWDPVWSGPHLLPICFRPEGPSLSWPCLAVRGCWSTDGAPQIPSPSCCKTSFLTRKSTTTRKSTRTRTRTGTEAPQTWFVFFFFFFSKVLLESHTVLPINPDLRISPAPPLICLSSAVFDHHK